jgi:hypothetical protein
VRYSILNDRLMFSVLPRGRTPRDVRGEFPILLNF